jgi:hypothetical protein
MIYPIECLVSDNLPSVKKRRSLDLAFVMQFLVDENLYRKAWIPPLFGFFIE